MNIHFPMTTTSRISGRLCDCNDDRTDGLVDNVRSSDLAAEDVGLANVEILEAVKRPLILPSKILV